MKKPRWERAFLAALSSGETIKGAAKLAGINRSTVNRKREADPDFDARFHDALEDGTDELQAVAHERALKGALRVETDGKGNVVRMERYTDSRLLIHQLEVRRYWRERQYAQQLDQRTDVQSFRESMAKLSEMPPAQVVAVYEAAVKDTRPVALLPFKGAVVHAVDAEIVEPHRKRDAR